MDEILDPVNLVVIGLVLLVTAWLAWGRRPLVACVLVSTSLLFSAAWFLPGGLVRATLGPTLVGGFHAWARQFPGTTADMAHFLGFAWLAVLLWAFRPDLRVMRIAGALVLMAIFSELLQGLLDWRQASVRDVRVNLIGALAGMAAAASCSAVAWCWRRFSRR